MTLPYKLHHSLLPQVASLTIRAVTWAFRPLYVLLTIILSQSLWEWIDFIVYLRPTSDDLTVLLLRLPLWMDSGLLYVMSACELIPSLSNICDKIPRPSFRGPPPGGPIVVPLPGFVQDVPSVRPSRISAIPEPAYSALVANQVNRPSASFIYI